MVREVNVETSLTATSIIPESPVNSDHKRAVIITQNNQPKVMCFGLINLDISNIAEKANNSSNSKLFDRKILFYTFLIIIIPSTKSVASFNLSRISQKDNGHDYARSKSVSEVNRSVNEAKTDQLFHSEADKTLSLQTELK
ncbi:hypothetical protein O181_008804 [Austropuccinia psidii MF-1]|uniref:Uncharacterized protein n=1 Tax=Austropuccinia psidii MF-1 TaxID=1389203 RepID=A0A9Q3GJ78_9BASI|nr:hypothetical protein [Austropuccinia psidii MF-1]